MKTFGEICAVILMSIGGIALFNAVLDKAAQTRVVASKVWECQRVMSAVNAAISPVPAEEGDDDI